MSDKLTYRIRVEELNGRKETVRIKAEPSYFAASPYASINWPDALNTELRVEVNWSSGGTTFDIEKARAFFKAGLAVCDKAEQLVAKGKP